MADLINNAVQFAESSTEVAQTASNPIMSILNAFMTNTASPEGHGSKTQQEEWEVLEADSKNPTQTETIIDGNSPISSNRWRSFKRNVWSSFDDFPRN